MKLYHGSNTGNLKILNPRQADHDRPYVYLTTLEAVAAIYLCNTMEKPYYWFPYGFEQDGSIPVYHELYANALQDASEGVKGYLYEVEVKEEQLLSLTGIPCARLAIEPVVVKACREIENAYELLMNFEKDGKLKVSRYEDKTDKQLQWWYGNLVDYLKGKDMVKTPDCSYARFIREKLPHVWEAYLSKPEERQKEE